jgi:hypothetical protein
VSLCAIPRRVDAVNARGRASPSRNARFQQVGGIHCPDRAVTGTEESQS